MDMNPKFHKGVRTFQVDKSNVCRLRGHSFENLIFIFLMIVFPHLIIRQTQICVRRLKDETKDATVVIVAQRVSTVIDADQIIVLDRGKIAGIGTHKELLETNDVYREIVESQLSEEEIA